MEIGFFLPADEFEDIMGGYKRFRFSSILISNVGYVQMYHFLCKGYGHAVRFTLNSIQNKEHFWVIQEIDDWEVEYLQILERNLKEIEREVCAVVKRNAEKKEKRLEALTCGYEFYYNGKRIQLE